MFVFHTGDEFKVSVGFPIIILDPSNNIELLFEIFVGVVIVESDSPVVVEVECLAAASDELQNGLGLGAIHHA